MTKNERTACRVGSLTILDQLESALEAGMAGVGRLGTEDRNEDFCNGLRCADQALRGWAAKRRADITSLQDADND
jgi:hypothetical protein